MDERKFIMLIIDGVQFEQCDECGVYHSYYANVPTDNGKIICDSCSEEWASCDNCGDYCHEDDMNRDGDLTLCNDCYHLRSDFEVIKGGKYGKKTLV